MNYKSWWISGIQFKLTNIERHVIKDNNGILKRYYKQRSLSLVLVYIIQKILYCKLWACLYQVMIALWFAPKNVKYFYYSFRNLFFPKQVNPFQTNVPFLYPLKTSENQR